MASNTCKLVWLKQLLIELQFGDVTQMILICDNHVSLHISSNLSFKRESNTLRLIIISFERRLHLETSRLSSLTQMIS